MLVTESDNTRCCNSTIFPPEDEHSGGQIVLLQPLVSSLSVNSCTVCWLRVDSVRSQPAYCTAVYRE